VESTRPASQTALFLVALAALSSFLYDSTLKRARRSKVL
jgi:hypothetical protein